MRARVRWVGTIAAILQVGLLGYFIGDAGPDNVEAATVLMLEIILELVLVSAAMWLAVYIAGDRRERAHRHDHGEITGPIIVPRRGRVYRGELGLDEVVIAPRPLVPVHDRRFDTTERIPVIAQQQATNLSGSQERFLGFLEGRDAPDEDTGQDGPPA